MAFTLAVAGKGGTGKSTLAAAVIQALIDTGRGPVLAVDADPNPNLGTLLGYAVQKTISELRDELLDHIRKLPAGVTKDDYLETGIQECLMEGPGVDLLVMGAGEGPRCYCAVNSVLRRCIDRLRGAYRYVVMDNEAGLEHLSRCTTQDIDVLLIVSNDLPASLQAASRIGAMTRKLALRIARQFLILNDVDDIDGGRLEARVHPTGIELRGVIPADSVLRQFSRSGEPLKLLAEESVARRAAREIIENILADTVPERTGRAGTAPRER